MLPATSTSRRKYRRDELAMLMKERKYADGSGSSGGRMSVRTVKHEIAELFPERLSLRIVACVAD